TAPCNRPPQVFRPPRPQIGDWDQRRARFKSTCRKPETKTSKEDRKPKVKPCGRIRRDGCKEGRKIWGKKMKTKWVTQTNNCRDRRGRRDDFGHVLYTTNVFLLRVPRRLYVANEMHE